MGPFVSRGACRGESCGGFVPYYWLQKCDPSLECVQDPNEPVDASGTCQEPIPQSCEPGMLGVADDGCNDCLCMEGGTWYCNDTACLTECEDGDHKMAADGCNECNCSVNQDGVGTWNCTKKACWGCIPGEVMTIDNGCNTCMCIPEDVTPWDEGEDGEANDGFDEPMGDPIPVPTCEDCLASGGTW